MATEPRSWRAHFRDEPRCTVTAAELGVCLTTDGGLNLHPTHWPSVLLPQGPCSKERPWPALPAGFPSSRPWLLERRRLPRMEPARLPILFFFTSPLTHPLPLFWLACVCLAHECVMGLGQNWFSRITEARCWGSWIMPGLPGSLICPRSLLFFHPTERMMMITMIMILRIELKY